MPERKHSGDWETRQGIPTQYEIDKIEEGKPPGNEPPPVPPPDDGDQGSS
ncbi:Protein of unknown function [Mycobacterium canettii CIPT 140070017]|nr:Protein of unknown function [Mycobacterium canettii CIPT 140070017]